MPALSNRSYAAGHFGLELDGSKISAYIKTVEGGFAKAAVVDEAMGPDVYHAKHLSVREIEPFTVELGLSGSKSMLLWIQESWNKKFTRRNGQVSHGDFNKFGQFEHSFKQALIMETGFPPLDGSSPQPSYLKVKFLPEEIETKQVQSARLLAGPSPKQKEWHNSNFRITIDGVDVSKGSKVDGFTIKQGVKAMHTGRQLFPELEPTKIEFPDLSIYLSLAFAKPMMAWYDKAVRTGAKDPSEEKTGSIEFLTPNRREVIFTVKLFEIGIKNYTINRSEGLQAEIKRAKIDLYVGRMELVPGSGLG